MRKYALLTLVGIALSGCSTLSFVPPKVENSARYFGERTITKAASYISDLSMQYDKSIENLANGQQMFDLPILGAAATAAGGLAFGAHQDLLLGSGLVAGTFGAGRQYYVVADRLKVLSDAQDALLCLDGTITETKFLESDIFNAYLGTLPADSETIKETVEAPRKVWNTIAYVERRVRLRYVTTSPKDFSSLTDDLIGQARTTAAKLKTFEIEKQSAGHGAAEAPMMAPPAVRNLADLPQVKKALAHLSKLDVALTDCKARI